MTGLRKIVTQVSNLTKILPVGAELFHGLLGHADRRSLPWYVKWPVPEAAVTVLCTPDDGCDGNPKDVE